MDFSDSVTCPFCGFEDMRFYGGNRGYVEYYFEMFCPICGFARWTDGRDPDSADVELAKKKVEELKGLSEEELEKIWELFEDGGGTPLIKRWQKETGPVFQKGDPEEESGS